MRRRSPTRALAPAFALALLVTTGCASSSARSSSTQGGEATPKPPPQGYVLVPGGTFPMGTSDGLAAEGPAHRVTLSPYLIQKTEVTVAEYALCVREGGCTRAPDQVEWEGLTDQELLFYSVFCNQDRGDRADHPVNCVDWFQANAYCIHRGARLPTEAEWEYAARATHGWTYPWGNEAPEPARLNVADASWRELALSLDPGPDDWFLLFDESDGWPTTAPVGSYPLGASPFGLLDMAGNVAEWVADWDGDYPSEPQTDPVGPVYGDRRVIRGGGWDSSDADWVRTTDRDGDVPTLRASDLGFRCVMDPD